MISTWKNITQIHNIYLYTFDFFHLLCYALTVQSLAESLVQKQNMCNLEAYHLLYVLYIFISTYHYTCIISIKCVDSLRVSDAFMHP